MTKFKVSGSFQPSNAREKTTRMQLELNPDPLHGKRVLWPCLHGLSKWYCDTNTPGFHYLRLDLVLSGIMGNTTMGMLRCDDRLPKIRGQSHYLLSHTLNFEDIKSFILVGKYLGRLFSYCIILERVISINGNKCNLILFRIKAHLLRFYIPGIFITVLPNHNYDGHL